MTVASLATMTVWPLALIAPTLWAMQRASVLYGGVQARPFGYIFAIIAIFTTRKFEIEALDHHNVQMMLMALILMSMMPSKDRAIDGAIVGVSLAVSLAVGLEILPFIAVISLMIGVGWIWNGKEARSKSILFATSFLSTMSVIYLLIKPDFSATVFRCDAFGPELFVIGLTGSIGLLAIATLFSSQTRMIRAVSMFLVGGAVVLTAKIFAPQCLANPYDPLYPEVAREWLSRISESRALFEFIKNGTIGNYGLVVIPVIAIVFTIYLWRDPLFRMRAFTLFATLILAYGMMFYQIRGLAFLLLLCVIPLAEMVGRAYGNYKETKRPVAGLIFIVLLISSFY